MGKFEFYQDCKVTSWERDYFTVEANSYEEAEAIVRSWRCKDVSNIIDCPVTSHRSGRLRYMLPAFFFQSLLVYILEPMILNQIYNNPRTV